MSAGEATSNCTSSGDVGRVRWRFPRHMRIARKSDFDRVMKAGMRAVDARITLWALPNGRAHPRLGLLVGRKHGSAVQRNRIKRLLREAFRLSQHELPAGFDLLCAPRLAGDVSLAGCGKSLIRLADQLARRWAQGDRWREHESRRRDSDP